MIYYEVKGKGKALFFIHGWGCDSRVWENQVARFSKRYRVITPDLRGHGRSEWKRAEDLLDALAEDILFLSKELNAAGADFVGWSFGCHVVFKLIEKAPAIANSIVLVGATPKFLRGGEFDFGLEEKEMRLMRRGLNRDLGAALSQFRRSIFTGEETSRKEFARLWSVLSEGPQPDREALISGLEILERADFLEDMARVRKRALIVCGGKDAVTPRGASEYIHRAIEGSSLEIIEGAGHAPFLTERNEFNRILEKWMEGT